MMVMVMAKLTGDTGGGDGDGAGDGDGDGGCGGDVSGGDGSGACVMNIITFKKFLNKWLNGSYEYKEGDEEEEERRLAERRPKCHFHRHDCRDVHWERSSDIICKYFRQ